MSEAAPTEATKETRTFTNHAVITVEKAGKKDLQLPTFRTATELSKIVSQLEAENDRVEIVKVVRGKEMKFRETRQISLF